MTPRVYRVPFGALSIDEALCTGCGACVSACPYGLIALEDEDTNAVLAEPDGCTACSACRSVCPAAAIAVQLTSSTDA
jgi:NAD-dependent dihydropyrimidine dehydrogenase PreA subunit